jgi:peptidoglycan hydrolase-like protein with peptidoglycan-binding domain
LRSASVLRLQTILSQRGAKVARDGLYGPQTASAWKQVATRKGLPAIITRVGPKTASVATNTYDALAVPAIP